MEQETDSEAICVYENRVQGKNDEIIEAREAFERKKHEIKRAVVSKDICSERKNVP